MATRKNARKSLGSNTSPLTPEVLTNWAKNVKRRKITLPLLGEVYFQECSAKVLSDLRHIDVKTTDSLERLARFISESLVDEDGNTVLSTGQVMALPATKIQELTDLTLEAVKESEGEA